MRVDQIGEIVAGATPSTSREEYWEGPIVWITPADLSTLTSRHLTMSERTLTELGLSRCAARLIPPRNLVISARGSVGHMALPVIPFCTNQSCFTLQFHGGQNPDFHYYNLQFWRRRIEDKCEGTTFGSISGLALASVEVPVPHDTKVQAKIAVVLARVDRAIEQTEALLAKQQRIKAGLMHDLLTRGLDAQGRLRDPATHRFKQSVFGFIPDDWDIRALAACTKEPVTYGIVQAGPHIPGGIPYIRTGDMNGDALVRDQMLCTSPEIASHFRRSELRAGEIVCAIRATIGKVLTVPPDLDGANLTQGTARISPRPDVDAAFLLWALRSTKVQTELQLQSKGTTFAEITLTDLRRAPVAVPRSLEEQRTIGKALNQHDALLKAHSINLAKLRRLKTGLMQDLLTGRVPVTPLLAEPQPAHAAA